MKRTLLSIVTLFTIALQCFSQNCDLTPEANRHKIRGEEFLKKAESKEYFKMVAEEWEKVLSIAPNCSDIVYQMNIVNHIERSVSRQYNN